MSKPDIARPDAAQAVAGSTPDSLAPASETGAPLEDACGTRGTETTERGGYPPSGYVLVPLKPSARMLAQAEEATWEPSSDRPYISEMTIEYMWNVMLAVAQEEIANG